MHALRHFLRLLAVVTCVAGAGQAQGRPIVATRDSQTVVFVCEHGTVKSVVAMALFATLARERHLPVRAVSRGTAPDADIPTVVRAGLRRDRLALDGFTPARFTESDLTGALAVISFDQPSVADLVAGRVPTSAWDSLPAVSANYDVARDAIRRRVTRLVDSLATVRTRPPR